MFYTLSLYSLSIKSHKVVHLLFVMLVRAVSFGTGGCGYFM